MKQVFISYPRDKAAGQAKARALYSALQKEQISAFLDDESIHPGDRWLSSLKQGIADCKVMLVVISKASDDRKWVEKEFNEALKHDILVIPVLVEVAEIPLQYSDLQAVVLYGDKAAEQQKRLFQTIRKTLGIDVVNPLIKKAIRAKRTEAYDTALELWQQVLNLNPKHARAKEEINTLNHLNNTKQSGSNLLQRLVLRLGEIQPVFNEIAPILNQAAKRPEALSLIEQTTSFLNNDLSSEAYIEFCKTILKPAANIQTQAQPADYEALAQRICKGEIALFLGSDIGREYGHELVSEQQMAVELAKQSNYENFDGGLSSIAEYLRLRPEYGASGLWDKLGNAMQQDPQDATLYRLLAQTEAPLILISSAYDDRLERCFQASRKLYVELTSIVCRSDDYDIGHVIVRYSDKKEPDRTYEAEKLSALKLQEAGYSVIYKIRGSCTPQGSQQELKRDALTVAESDYFTFARYAEKIIPNYLTTLLRGRGFLFVGFSPDRWEQRLLVNALLSKRTHASDECYTIGVSQDPLEAAYWQKQKVQHYDVNLSELDDHIEEVLL